jgi:hypothetical protein
MLKWFKRVMSCGMNTEEERLLYDTEMCTTEVCCGSGGRVLRLFSLFHLGAVRDAKTVREFVRRFLHLAYK